MNWKDVANLLPKGLELVGQAVGGPIGMAAAGVGSLMAQALGVGADPDSVAAAIKADPQSAAKLIELQTNAKVQLQQIASSQIISLAQEETKRQAAELADVQSARARDTAIIAAGHTNVRANWMVFADVFGLVSCVSAAVAMHLNDALDVASSTLLTTFASYFGLSLRDAHQFEFGSSRSSREKDQTLSDLAKMP